MSSSSIASSTTTNPLNDSIGLNGSSSTLQCRVQYLDDTDPFASVNLPEPARPPSFTFLTSTVLSNQLSSVQKVLNAPHKVSPFDSQIRFDRTSSSFASRSPTVHYNCADKKEVNPNWDLISISIKLSMNNAKKSKLLPKGSFHLCLPVAT